MIFHLTDWLKAAQAFMILSLFLLPAALGLYALVTFMPDFEKNMTFVGAAVATTGTAALFTFICVATFGAKFQEYFDTKEPQWEKQGDIGVLDWAFGLAVVDMILTVAAVVLGVLGL